MTARRGVFWPLLLIALGLIFLLQNFGFISGVSWLAVASLWPLLLVLIGLDIAFARRWPVPTLAAEVAVIAAGLALVAYSPNLSPGIFVFGDGDLFRPLFLGKALVLEPLSLFFGQFFQ